METSAIGRKMCWDFLGVNDAQRDVFWYSVLTSSCSRRKSNPKSFLSLCLANHNFSAFHSLLFHPSTSIHEPLLCCLVAYRRMWCLLQVVQCYSPPFCYGTCISRVRIEWTNRPQTMIESRTKSKVNRLLQIKGWEHKRYRGDPQQWRSFHSFGHSHVPITPFPLFHSSIPIHTYSRVEILANSDSANIWRPPKEVHAKGRSPPKVIFWREVMKRNRSSSRKASPSRSWVPRMSSGR